jgi:hypothetical protein
MLACAAEGMLEQSHKMLAATDRRTSAPALAPSRVDVRSINPKATYRASAVWRWM